MDSQTIPDTWNVVQSSEKKDRLGWNSIPASLTEASKDGWSLGLRPNFNSERKSVEIVTNYLQLLETPTDLFKYALKFGKLAKQTANKEKGHKRDKPERDISKRSKGLAIKALMVMIQSEEAAERKKMGKSEHLCWATDDMHFIATTSELLCALSDVVKNVTFSIANGSQETVDITVCACTIHRLPRSGLQSFIGDPGQRKDFTELAAILNAFLTKHVKSSPDVMRIGPNRFFLFRGGGDNSREMSHTKNAAQTLRVLRGYFLSVRPGMDNILVNINTTAATFHRRMLLSDFLQVVFPHDCREADVAAHRREAEYLRKRKILKDALRGIRVIRQYTTESGQERASATITGFGKCPSKESFVHGVREVTVADFFQNHHGHSVRERDMFCVNVGAEDPRSVEKPTGAALIPPELLMIDPDQPARSNLAQRYVSDIIEFAARGAAANRDLIAARGPGGGLGLFGLDSGEMTHCGFQVGSNLLRITPRFLPPPQLLYAPPKGPGAKSTVKPAIGSWDLSNVQFRQIGTNPARIQVLELLLPHWQSRKHQIASFAMALLGQMKAHGFQFDGPENQRYVLATPIVFGRSDSELVAGQRSLEQFLKSQVHKTDFVIIVLPQRDVSLYNAVKRVADVDIGIHTVCCTSQTATKNDRAATINCANLALKINLKLGGINHAIAKEEFLGMNLKETMIVGADVTHLGVGAPKGCPSVAAVVASCDDRCVQFPGSMRLQASRQENLTDLRDMMIHRLKLWRRVNGGLPKNILFFRDGVSESQFADCERSEVGRIKEAYQKLAAKGDSDVNVTFLVVNKRHHTRFYPLPGKEKMENYVTETGESRKPNDNLKPGLLVETDVTHRFSSDFYLQSHQAIKGTARSAHYFVLRNDMNLKADELHKITHTLCYNYQRATKAVSYCQPAYYADRLCDRGKVYLSQSLASRHEIVQPYTAETTEAFNQRCLVEILRTAPIWQHSRGNPGSQSTPRHGPWNQNLDDTMFYL